MKNNPTAPRRLLTLLLFTILCTCASAQEVLQDRNFIRIDQFGYLPGATKVAVIAEAVNGYNSGEGIDLNEGAEISLIDAATDEVVFSAYPKLWNGGSVDGLSGDRGAWFDFTEVDRIGTYRIRVTKQDGGTAESYEFRIADGVYDDVMRAAVNFFYYQRFNQDKPAQYASGEPWTDGPWFDRDYQEYNVKQLDNPENTLDLHGGWFDAGDPNKYVSFAIDAVHNLLTAYDNAPEFWNDFDLNIPESDNDTPDLLDEVKFEIDWIKRMQAGYNPDAETAGIIQKMGILEDVAYISPPSTDERERWYNGVCVSSTITGAGMLAHAAVSYRSAGVWPEEVAELTDRAAKAFAYYERAPDKSELCDDGRIEAGDADGPGNQYAEEHLALATTAAVYLFELTGEEKYKDFIAANYREARPWKARDWGVYRANQGEALLFYTKNPNADAATVQGILEMKSSTEKSEGGDYVVAEAENLYRSNVIYFNWGSNSLISRQAADIMDLYLYDIKPENAAAYSERGQSIINYLHGTNPVGTCMLSNMYQYGADLCADEMWHSWFAADTRFDNIDGDNVGPAPGFITGGPNPQGQASMPIKLGTFTFDARAGDQPQQKAFSVDNFWQNGPWAYNEPAIYYQAAYVKALSYFVAGDAAEGETGNGIPAVNDCQEMETNFTVAADVGANGTVEADGNSPGSTGGASVKLFDAGDAATTSFTLAQGRSFDLALRVRVGEAAGTDDNLAGNYRITLDGDTLEYELDTTSIGSIQGDTYWGEIVVVDVALAAGDHTLTVTAGSDWLKLDRLCWRDPNTLPTPPPPPVAEGECLEAETVFETVSDVGDNGDIRADNFTGGATGDSYINMFDVGDGVRFTFDVTEAGDHQLRFRLRTGQQATDDDRDLIDAYRITVDEVATTTILDEESISELFGDTYWGTLVATVSSLDTGSHTITVEAAENWLKFDQFCFANGETTGLFTSATGAPAAITLQPNPNDGRSRLRLTYTTPSVTATVSLYDLTGRLVSAGAYDLNAGAEHQLELDYRALGLQPGVYLIRVSIGALQLGSPRRFIVGR